MTGRQSAGGTRTPAPDKHPDSPVQGVPASISPLAIIP